MLLSKPPSPWYFMSVQADQDSPLLGSRQERPLERRLLPRPRTEPKWPWAAKQDVWAAALLMSMVTRRMLFLTLRNLFTPMSKSGAPCAVLPPSGLSPSRRVSRSLLEGTSSGWLWDAHQLSESIPRPVICPRQRFPPGLLQTLV